MDSVAKPVSTPRKGCGEIIIYFSHFYSTTNCTHCFTYSIYILLSNLCLKLCKVPKIFDGCPDWATWAAKSVPMPVHTRLPFALFEKCWLL